MHDVDCVVIGSGFGGAVSALRMTEKGYSVVVLEQGRRLQRDDVVAGGRSVRRLIWEPALGLRGYFRQWIFPDVAVVGGVAVGRRPRLRHPIGRAPSGTGIRPCAPITTRPSRCSVARPIRRAGFRTPCCATRRKPCKPMAALAVSRRRRFISGSTARVSTRFLAVRGPGGPGVDTAVNACRPASMVPKTAWI